MKKLFSVLLSLALLPFAAFAHTDGSFHSHQGSAGDDYSVVSAGDDYSVVSLIILITVLTMIGILLKTDKKKKR